MKSVGMFSGYCEDLRRLLDMLTDEQYAAEMEDNAELRLCVEYIGYKRKRKESEHYGSKNKHRGLKEVMGRKSNSGNVPRRVEKNCGGFRS